MIDAVLGLHRASSGLTFENMAARSVVVFIVGIAILRLGARRGIARSAGYDVLLAVVLGSVLSRAINGQAPFFPTLGVSAVLVFLHEFVSFAAGRVHWFSVLVKGSARVLVREGEIDDRSLARSFMSRDDLDENLRLNGNISNPSEVAEARLERSGQISVITKRAAK